MTRKEKFGVLLIVAGLIIGLTSNYAYAEISQEECNQLGIETHGISLDNTLVVCDFPFDITVDTETRVLWLDLSPWNGTYSHTITNDNGKFDYDNTVAVNFLPGVFGEGFYPFYDKLNPHLQGSIDVIAVNATQVEVVEEIVVLEPKITTSQAILNNGMNAVTISGEVFPPTQNMEIQLIHDNVEFGTYSVSSTDQGTFALLVEVPVEKVGVFDVNVVIGEITTSSSFEQIEANITTSPTPTTVVSNSTTTTSTPEVDPINDWLAFVKSLSDSDKLELLKALLS